MTLIDVPSGIGLIAVSLACGAAWRFGGPLERRGAAWIGASWVMTPLLQVLTGDYDPVSLFAVVDVTELLGLSALTWRSGRVWPVVAVGAQSLALGVDLVRLFLPRMSAWTYVTALSFTAYVLLLALLSGVWTVWRARRRDRREGRPELAGELG